MKCLRCGYCCKNLFVVIVKDPEQGIVQDNLISHEGNGKPCIHLKGKPFEYSCALHNKEWYKETPCFAHEQYGHKDAECRIGRYLLDKEKNGKTKRIATSDCSCSAVF